MAKDISNKYHQIAWSLRYIYIYIHTHIYIYIYIYIHIYIYKTLEITKKKTTKFRKMGKIINKCNHDEIQQKGLKKRGTLASADKDVQHRNAYALLMRV